MKRGRLNKIEQALIDAIERAKQHCTGELEMIYHNHYNDECLSGWYAMDYKEDFGGVFPITTYGYDKPLINNALIEKGNVDVDKCFTKCHVYVSR